MFKKVLFLAAVFTAISFGFISCANDDDDDDEQTPASDYSAYYGTYTGTMSVTYGGSTTETSVSITVAEESVDQGGNYGAYTHVLWLTNSDGKAVVAAQSDSTNTSKGDLTEENYTTVSSCYITFNGDNTATYIVPAMAAMGGTATITKSE